MPYDLHVVRTLEWMDSAKSPITHEEVDLVIQDDPDLAWSADFIEMQEAEGVVRFYMIDWKGQSSFYWYRDQIVSASPDGAKVVKLVEIGDRLKAYVIGDEGERYVMSRDFLGRRKLKVTKT